MYNIQLKFTVIASCGATIVTVSPKQYLIHRKIENNNSCEGTELDSHSKKGNKTPRYPVSCSCIFKGLSVCSLEGGINSWPAVKDRLFWACFDLSNCHTHAASFIGTEGWSIYRSSKMITMEPNQELSYSRSLLYLVQKQKSCDGGVTLYLLPDQMARVTDLCKPRAVFTIWRLLGEIKQTSLHSL